MRKKITDKKYKAASFLAAAAQKLLPEVLLIQSGESQLGFYYDFYLPYLLSENQLDELERTANYLISNAKISFKEMLKDNAKSYLEHLGQPKRKILTNEELVNLIEINQFVDFIPVSSTLENTKKIFIKLHKVSCVDKNTYRVHGYVFENSKESFIFLKNLKNYEKCNFLTNGKKRKWFELIGENLFFHPKGVVFKNKILNFILDELKSLGCHPVQSYPLSHKELFNKDLLNHKRIYEVISGKNFKIEENDPLNIQTNLFVKKTILIFNNEFELECISSLQSILKMLNILGFRCSFELCVSTSTQFKDRKHILENVLKNFKIEYELEDTHSNCELKIFAKDKIGREWNISSLKLEENTIESSFCSSLNRWIALLTESDELTFEILPEHVRIMLLDRKYKIYADNIKNEVQKAGFTVEIDDSDRSLNEKIYEAKMQAVPFVVVIGEKEARLNMIAVRSNNSSKMNMINLSELLENLNQKEKIENQ